MKHSKREITYGFWKNKDNRGQGLVELALVMPIFILLFFALIQFGSIRYAEILMHMAIRHGGRIETLGGNGRQAIKDYLSDYSIFDMDNVDVRIGRRWIFPIYATEIEIKYFMRPMTGLKNIFPDNFHIKASYTI